MEIQELIERYESYEGIWDAPGTEAARICFLRDLKQLDDPYSGHAEEAPRYVKNVLARLRELPLHDREVWLKAIMSEFEQDFSHAKWREGYEQGKFEGMIEREKVKIPQFVAGWIEYCKFTHVDLQSALAVGDVYFYNYANQKDFSKLKEFLETENNQELFARAWLDGYEVEKEKRYLVTLKNGQPLVKSQLGNTLYFNQNITAGNYKASRKELEDAGFGWVFDCPGIEIEEVQEGGSR